MQNYTLTSDKNDKLIVDKDLYDALKNEKIVRINIQPQYHGDKNRYTFNIRIDGKYVSLNRFFRRSDGKLCRRKNSDKHHILGNHYGYDFRAANYYGDVEFENFLIETANKLNTCEFDPKVEKILLPEFIAIVDEAISRILLNTDISIPKIISLLNHGIKGLENQERKILIQELYTSDISNENIKNLL